MPINQTCPYCHFALIATGSFCPNCGKALEKKPLSITLLKQIIIYLVSFCLPPLGLAWGFKYLREDNQQAKRIGLIAILLTIISLVLTVWLSMTFVNNFNQSLKEETEFYDLVY